MPAVLDPVSLSVSAPLGSSSLPSWWHLGDITCAQPCIALPCVKDASKWEGQTGLASVNPAQRGRKGGVLPILCGIKELHIGSGVKRRTAKRWSALAASVPFVAGFKMN